MKNLKKFRSLLLLPFIALSLSSCSEDSNAPADVTIELEHNFGTQGFTLNTAYNNGSSESVTLSTFKYYISNIQLLTASGNWSEPESYRLIDLSTSTSTTLTIPDVPAGEYTGIRFLLGVDSTRNVSGAQTGALDPANNMFWSWNSGYIFFKAEGTSPQASGGMFHYHIGGFSGANNALQWVTLNFNGDNLLVKEGNENMSHVSVDVKALFDGPNTLSVAASNNVTMPGSMAVNIAENYATMFEFEHNHN